jgi:hypothetical protein
MPLKDPEARKQYMKEYREKNLARFLERDREYRETHKEEIYEKNKKYVAKNIEKQRGWVKKACVKWRKKSGSEYYSNYRRKEGEAEKITARWKLNEALKRGQIQRPKKCSRCGVECTPHGHHPDYSKPLEVVWLCGICHKAEHASL